MDAADDQDINIRKSAPSLISELKTSVPRFLWKPKAFPGGSNKVRTLVYKRKTDQLIQLLEPFQEWPQLLDQHLRGLVEDMSTAFIEYLSNHAAGYGGDARCCEDTIVDAESATTPLPRAICRILYILCKIRGEKVIVQLLNNEAKYMESMLSALESWGRSDDAQDETNTARIGMTWEERFIMLLWLSHYMLAPFDLVTMASDSAGLISHAPSMSVSFLENTPPVAQRLIRLCFHYIAFASKERETASALLARLALRSDMRRLGLQRTLISWALLSLEGTHNGSAPTAIYVLLGTLAFLAKFVESADNGVLKSLLMPIYRSVQRARYEHSPLLAQMTSSPIARKVVIKIERTLAVAGIKMDFADSGSDYGLEEDALNEIVDHLLTALEDRDTSVRIAASKALSVIAMRLDIDMVVQIVEVILEKLNEDTLFEDLRNNQSMTVSELTTQGSGQNPDSFELSLDNVNAVKWHGLVLTLSQLIFRGSMPAPLTYEALRKLNLALSFEQRASSGAAIGTNVRDAACFGLWSLARRYSTEQLSGYNSYDWAGGSIFQALANQLVVAATLDPAGNIRRGASAALQELIGRHPNTITDGIRLVGIVDYNAVALRSRAITGVATTTAQINRTYWDSILDGLLGWRGIASPDAPSRRNAAMVIGSMTLSSDPNYAKPETVERVRKSLRKTALSNVRKRHGLLFAMAEIILAIFERTADLVKYCDDTHKDWNKGNQVFKPPVMVDLPMEEAAELWRVFYTDMLGSLFRIDDIEPFKGDIALHLDSPLIAEAACFLMFTLATAAAWPLAGEISRSMPKPSPEDLQICLRILQTSLRQSDPMVVFRSSQAAEALFNLLDSKSREDLVLGWAERLRPFGSNPPGTSTFGATAALGAIFAQAGTHRFSKPMTNIIIARLKKLDSPTDEVYITSPLRAFIIDTLLGQIIHANSIGLRCATLRSLSTGIFKSEGVTTRGLVEALHMCLQDYTIDQRGDIGSLVRMEAIDAVTMILRKKLLNVEEEQKLIARICGLAVEKLDKVRYRAWGCLQPNWDIFGLVARPSITISDMAQTSTSAYFEQIISLSTRDYIKTWVRQPLLEGFVTSAGAGSETVLRASREAFTAHVKTLDEEVATRGEEGKLRILCSHVVDIMPRDSTDDRLVLDDRLNVPTLEFLAFLCDSGILHRLSQAEFGWGHLLNKTQELVGKTSNMRKLMPATRIYAACAMVERVRAPALKKLCQMLLHRFPKVRNAAADAVFLVTEDEKLLQVDWSKPVKELRDIIHELSARLDLEGEIEESSP